MNEFVNINEGFIWAKLYNPRFTIPGHFKSVRFAATRSAVPQSARINKSSATAVRGPAVTNSSIKQVTPWSAVFQCTRVRKHVPPRSAVCGHSYKSRGCRDAGYLGKKI